MLRRAAALLRPTTTFTQQDRTGLVWRMQTDAGPLGHQIIFTLGQPVTGSYNTLMFSNVRVRSLNIHITMQQNDTTIDGREVVEVFSWEDPDSLVELQSSPAAPQSTITRRFSEHGINMSMQANDVLAHTIFTRVVEVK